MKMTNRLNLPQPLVDAVANDTYSRGEADISITGLIKPPRVSVLEEHHAHEIEEDVSDHVFRLLGQVVHGILERANKTGVAERRLVIEVEGWRVSGGMDIYYADGLLQDYKLTTVYKFKGGGVPDEFVAQLNCYAELLRQHGCEVKKLEIVGILRDWSLMEAKRNIEIPRAQVVVRSVELWPQAKAQAYLRERVVLHKQARLSLPQCSPEDRWHRGEKWAVMKKGRKTAVKLYDTLAEAAEAAGGDSALSVEHRPGQSIRCENYCSVSLFCTQFQEAEGARVPVMAAEDAS